MDAKPNITISSLDVERLEALLESPAAGAAKVADLEAELGRAEIVAPEDMPPGVVSMNSTVRFREVSSDREFCMTLVYPKDVAGHSDRISILAPVGSALLGLSQGDSIEWPAPSGGVLQVRIEEVVYQPERAGELHR